MKTVIAFGTFDVLHPGHYHFLTQAKALGDRLVVVLPPDHMVAELKHKTVRNTLTTRIKNLQALNIADHVVAGDDTQGAWQPIYTYTPDIVAIGHDQDALERALLAHTFPFPITTARISYLAQNEAHS